MWTFRGGQCLNNLGCNVIQHWIFLQSMKHKHLTEDVQPISLINKFSSERQKPISVQKVQLKWCLLRKNSFKDGIFSEHLKKKSDLILVYIFLICSWLFSFYKWPMFLKRKFNRRWKVPWKQKMYKQFDLFSPSGCSINIYIKEILFCSESELLWDQTCCFTLHKWRVEIGWNVTCLILLPDMFFSHTNLSHDCAPFWQDLKQLMDMSVK